MGESVFEISPEQDGEGFHEILEEELCLSLEGSVNLLDFNVRRFSTFKSFSYIFFLYKILFLYSRVYALQLVDGV